MQSTPARQCSSFDDPRPGRFFDSLPSRILRDFRSFSSLVSYPQHAMLFEEQQEASGILILVEGCVKISVNSSEGRRLILWIARPTELLGLAAVLRGCCHEVTAETLHPCTIASIRRQEFLDFLIRYPAAYDGIVRELSMEMSRACTQMRIIGFSSSASAKLAWLLLDWSSRVRSAADETSVTVPLTHGEMGECIGATRETVSRAMAGLRLRRLIDVHGSAVVIRSRFALEAFAQGLHEAVPPEANRARPPRFLASHPRAVTEISAGRGV
jgi:CRP/FNR family cyclic AMP-dependent transcriptional regulator